MICQDTPSPNFNQRRDGAEPDLVVLHYTAMETADAAIARLCAPEYEVSAHYLICQTGTVHQLVDEKMRAWHAGSGQWGAVTDVNSRSIGIELANCGYSPFSEPQMTALEKLLGQIMQRWAIVPKRVIGHSDMAPGRKNDPGARFDWCRLAQSGLSVWPDSNLKAPQNADFVEQLQRFGMTGKADETTLLAAFRLRFRPWATGPLQPVDLAIAENLARRFPVDLPRPCS